MNIKNCLVSCALGLILLGGPVQAAQPSESANYEHALSLYQQHEWSRAFGEFSRLADSGHQQAAYITLFMLQHGPQLYATSWSAPEAHILRLMRVSKTSTPMFEADGGD